jgi:hypothetical protein
VSRRQPVAREERLNTPFIRAIGCLAMASFELQLLMPAAGETAEQSRRSWGEFAEHLLANSTAVMEGACGSTFPGNTISIVRDGVQVAVEVDYIEKLTERMRRHVKIGHALGVGDEELSLTA